jgi:hypothetical protein
MIVKQFVKWFAAGALALGAIPAIGMAHPHASLPASAISVTPTSVMTVQSPQTTHRISHTRATAHRTSHHRRATSKHRAGVKHTAAHSQRTASRHRTRAASHRSRTHSAVKHKSAPQT